MNRDDKYREVTVREWRERERDSKFAVQVHDKDDDHRTDQCPECHREGVKMATKTLCFTCYRRARRADERSREEFDRHSPAVRKEHTKVFRGYTGLMQAMADLRVGSADVTRILGIVSKYLDLARPFLNPEPESIDQRDGKAPNHP